jgi:hypothetical protein
MKLLPRKIDQISSNVSRYRCSAVAVLRIMVVILSSQIVNEGKVFHHSGISPGVFRKKQQPVMPDTRPMGRTMNPIPIEPKFTPGKLYKTRRY